jgi:hypothetical protein
MKTLKKPFAVILFGSVLLFGQLPNPLDLPDPLHLSDSPGLPNPLNLPDPLGLSKSSQSPSASRVKRGTKHHRVERYRKPKKLYKHGK